MNHDIYASHKESQAAENKNLTTHPRSLCTSCGSCWRPRDKPIGSHRLRLWNISACNATLYPVRRLGSTFLPPKLDTVQYPRLWNYDPSYRLIRCLLLLFYLVRHCPLLRRGDYFKVAEGTSSIPGIEGRTFEGNVVCTATFHGEQTNFLESQRIGSRYRAGILGKERDQWVDFDRKTRIFV